MSTHKTPYEIRLNLLQLAQQIEHDRMAAESMMESERDVVTKAPAVQDIVKAAEALNDFVSRPNS